MPLKEWSNETKVSVYENRDFEDIEQACLGASAVLEIAANLVLSDDSTAKNQMRLQILSDPQTAARFDRHLRNESNSAGRTK